MTYDVIARARRTTRRRMLTAVCAATAMLAGAVAIAVFGVSPDRSATSPADPALTIRPDASPTAGDRMALPSDLDWVDLAGVSVPASGRSGPYFSRGGLAYGFAHDRAGAVLAAVHIVVRVNPQVGPAVFEPTLRDQVVGPDAASMRVQVAQAYDELRGQAGVAPGRPLGRLYATLRGYRILSYTDDEAVLWLLTEAPGATGSPLTVSTEVRVRWTGSDWVLVAPAGGTFDQAVTTASDPDIATFLPFTTGG
ncbi:hypothetical protein ABZ738_30085 [Micromonospora sp. NPDC047793]|uniref:hypothetical protein n=1 Tax=unclassified Micromonospora TaxID=2617518 RepID=UPI0033E8E6FB